MNTNPWAALAAAKEAFAAAIRKGNEDIRNGHTVEKEKNYMAIMAAWKECLRCFEALPLSLPGEDLE